MYIIIEHCSDGSYEPVSYLGCYDTKYAAHAAMIARMNRVTDNYTAWRGIPWDNTDITEDSAACYYDADGSVFTWYIFDVDKPYDINGYA